MIYDDDKESDDSIQFQL